MPIIVQDGDKKEIPDWKPTKWENRVNEIIRPFSSKVYLNRLQNQRQSYYFRYLAAYPTTARSNASPFTSGETLLGSREKMAIMWNAINLIENSGLCDGILTKIVNYICGTLKYQARTGDRGINRVIQQYVASRSGKEIDVSGRNTLRQIAQGLAKSIFLKGDVGCNIPRVGKNLYLQAIEGDRIGDPYDYQISNEFVRGVRLDESTARMIGFDIYVRDRMSGRYVYDKTLAARDGMGFPSFVFSANRVSLDDVRGVTIFKTAINNATYIDKMREYELLAMLWASTKSGVYYTESGLLPPSNGGRPFGNAQTVNPTFPGSAPYQAVKLNPAEITALGVTEKVELFNNDRPSPNVIAMYNNTIQDIAAGVKLSLGFCWSMSGIPNPAIRYASNQDKRQIASWQDDIFEDLLEPIKNMMILDGMASGEIPYHPRAFDGVFIFPAPTTIDVGKESEKDIDEINAGINSGTRVAIENGNGEIEEITDEIGHEATYRIKIAKQIAAETGLDFREVLGMMRQVTGETRQAPVLEAAQAAQAGAAADKSAAQAKDDPGRVGATDEGEGMQ